MNSHKLYEFFAASLTAVTVTDVVHWSLGIPAAFYYGLKWYRMLKDKKARE